MKVLQILTISCITLALCHGDCSLSPPQAIIKDGKLVAPDGCIDPSDNSKHDLGSEWNAAECQRCSCNSKGEVECCSRYGGPAEIKGCTAVKDPETCTYKFYEDDDSTKPCSAF